MEDIHQMKTALICGISGQDGAYLAELLLGKGYRVVGGSRDAQINAFGNLQRLGIRDSVQTISMNLGDFRSVIQAITRTQPDEIYNLAGQSSVGLSFEQPMETMESISVGTFNLLEAIRFSGGSIKLYNAGSGECFGNTGDAAANESTPFHPRSPYGVAKAAAFWASANYREAYDLFACTGILFNHESPLRPDRFVTQKIVRGAYRIAKGEQQALQLGNISIRRDWGWAPEFVEAMWLMLQQERPEDFVIATGRNSSLEEFVAEAFEHFGLNWRESVSVDQQLFRPSDIAENRGDPFKAGQILGWKPKCFMKDVVRLMAEAAIDELKSSSCF